MIPKKSASSAGPTVTVAAVRIRAVVLGAVRAAVARTAAES